MDTNPDMKAKYLSLFMKIQVNTYEMNHYAMGLFTPQNFLNHSCSPNAEIFFYQK